jgi:hypothetical protein
MRRLATVLLAVGLLVPLGCAKKAETPAVAAQADAGIKAANDVSMDTDTQVRMGVKVAPVLAGKAPQHIAGYAKVMDVGSLAAIESEVSAAVATAASSQEEYRRLQALAAHDQAASARSVEAARAQAASDAARARLAGRRIGLEWGASIENMSASARSALLTDIASGRAALLRIDAAGATEKVTRVTVQPEESGAPITVAIIGQAAGAEAKLQTAGLLGLVRGTAAQALPTGRLLQADLEMGRAVEGFLIPAGALVRTDNSLWVYMKTGEVTFAKRDVGAGRALGDGWFVAEGFKPDEQIVVEGAGSLLAAEHGPVEAE